jgi:hypothetical protein
VLSCLPVRRFVASDAFQSSGFVEAELNFCTTPGFPRVSKEAGEN